MKILIAAYLLNYKHFKFALDEINEAITKYNNGVNESE